MKSLFTQRCPTPPGLQVRYMRFGMSFTPRSSEPRNWNALQVNCVASSMNIQSYSCPLYSPSERSPAQWPKRITLPLAKYMALRSALYFANAGRRACLMGSMWLFSSSG